MAVGRVRRGILERLREARQGDYLRFLGDVENEQVANMELVAGPGYDWWGRNYATVRLAHLRQRAGQPAEPVENDLFSIFESARAPFNDNVPAIEWLARRAAAVPNLWVYRRMWDWITTEVAWRDLWLAAWDLVPECGISNAKAGWDAARDVPMAWRHDQRDVLYDRGTRLNHRTASVIQENNLIDAGELRDLYPALADKIVAGGAATSLSGARDRELDRARATGIDTAQGNRWARSDEDAVLKTTWFRMRPDRRKLAETEHNAPDAYSAEFRNDPWLGVVWIPGADVVDEILVDGCRIVSAQQWRCAEHVVGLCSTDMVIGLAQAAHRYQMRGHRFRLAAALPRYMLPRDTGVEKKHLLGAENTVLQPSTFETARGIGYEQVGRQSEDLTEWLVNVEPKIRRILGTDRISTDTLTKQLTATQVRATREAIEVLARQSIANFSPWAVDLAARLMEFTIENRLEPIEVARADGEGFDLLTPDMWMDLDARDVAARTSTDRSGALTDSGKLASVGTLLDFGLFRDENGNPDIPIDAAEEIVQIANPPRTATWIASLRRRHAAEALMAEEEAATAAAATEAASAAEQAQGAQEAAQAAAVADGAVASDELGAAGAAIDAEDMAAMGVAA
jgi:hypothetical protein